MHGSEFGVLILKWLLHVVTLMRQKANSQNSNILSPLPTYGYSDKATSTPYAQRTYSVAITYTCQLNRLIKVKNLVTMVMATHF